MAKKIARKLDLYTIQQLLLSGSSIYDLNLRVTYYARVSTDEEDQVHSLRAQVKYYNDFVGKIENWTLVPGYYDEGITGTSVKKRDDFNRMIDDARQHKFDLIITKEISRFSRNTVDSIQYTRELLRLGIGVYFQNDNINTLLPDSELRLTIMASMAQEESRKTHERVKFGNRRSIENGVVLGNNNFYGYEKDNGKLVIVPEEAKMIQMIFDLYANKRYGLRKIGRALYDAGYRNANGKRLSETTIKRCLENPKYKGMYCGGKTTKFNHLMPDIKHFPPEKWVMYKDETGEVVPAIVSEELWDRANKLMKDRASLYSKEDKRPCYHGSYSYSGKIFCEADEMTYCRGIYRYKHSDGTVKEREVWQCAEYVHGGRKACQSPVLYTSELDEIMGKVIKGLMIEKEKIVARLESIYQQASSDVDYAQEIEAQEQELEKIKKKKDKLLELLMDDLITKEEFEERNCLYTKDKDDALQRLEELKISIEKSKTQASEFGNIRNYIYQCLDFEKGYSKGLIDSFLEKIVVKRESTKSEISLEIYLKFNRNPSIARLERQIKGASTIYLSEDLWWC